jgi:putative peptidoglycan lipid II flippase
MEKKHLIFKNMSYVSIGILISRILGYFRDMLVASVFGAGFYADAFYAAFRIPNLFRRLFGENSLNAVFVPVFSEVLQKEEKHNIEEFISAVSTVMFILLSIITITGIIFAFPLTKFITWGFPKEKIVVTSKLLQIMFPYMIFICFSALWLSILNCLKIFFIPAMSSASLSVTEIIFILFIAYSLPEKQRVYGLAISVLAGGVLQFLVNYLMIVDTYKIKLKIKKLFYYLNLPEIKKMVILFIPVIIGFSADQINALVDTLCASFLKEGSVTALYYSNRLMQLPLALFAISMMTVALPQMSAEAVSNNYDELKQTMIHSVRNITYFILPAALGLIILGKPIIKVLFERGKFTQEATSMTYSCLAFYSLGLLSFSISKILISVFYALKNTKYPVKVAFCTLIVNIILNITLMQFLAVGGLALATSLSSTLGVILLWSKIEPKIKKDVFIMLKNFFIKIVFVNFLFIIFLLCLKLILKQVILLTLVGILIGIPFYLLCSYLFKIEETKIIGKFLGRFIPFIYE